MEADNEPPSLRIVVLVDEARYGSGVRYRQRRYASSNLACSEDVLTLILDSIKDAAKAIATDMMSYYSTAHQPTPYPCYID